MRICIKIGTALISRGNRLNYRWLKGKVREIAALHNQGNEIVIVSSGAGSLSCPIPLMTQVLKGTPI